MELCCNRSHGSKFEIMVCFCSTICHHHSITSFIRKSYLSNYLKLPIFERVFFSLVDDIISSFTHQFKNYFDSPVGPYSSYCKHMRTVFDCPPQRNKDQHTNNLVLRCTYVVHEMCTVAECHACMFVSTAKKIQLSQDSYNALTSFGCYVTTFRGEMEVKVMIYNIRHVRVFPECSFRNNCKQWISRPTNTIHDNIDSFHQRQLWYALRIEYPRIVATSKPMTLRPHKM